MLSKRGDALCQAAYPLMEGFALYRSNPHDPVTNPAGCINLGTAESSLLSRHLATRLQHLTSVHHSQSIVRPEDFAYADFAGLASFRNALVSLFARTNLHHALLPDHLCLMNGCGTVVETLVYTLCDPLDAVLIPTPYYGGFDKDIEQRLNVRIRPITPPSSSSSSLRNNFEFTMENVDEAFSSYPNVKAIVVMNPVNPTGHVYPPSLIADLMTWCLRRKVHLIIDEIYAYSIFKPSSFQSALSLEHYKEAKEYVHWVWGFSKDFAMNGYRVGLLGSQNENVLKACKEASYFTGISTVVQRILEGLITDHQFIREYFHTHTQRLLETSEYVKSYLHRLNASLSESGKKVRWLDPVAGFFLWIDLTDIVRSRDEERRLFLALARHGVYVAPGEAFHGDPGWFRIIFSHDESVLDTAMERFGKTVMQFVENKF